MDIGWSNVTERKFELDTPVKIIHLNIRGFCSKSEELTISLILKLTHILRFIQNITCSSKM